MKISYSYFERVFLSKGPYVTPDYDHNRSMRRRAESEAPSKGDRSVLMLMEI